MTNSKGRARYTGSDTGVNDMGMYENLLARMDLGF